MKKRIIFLILVVFGFTFLSGCLTVETKEYSFKLKKDGSGSGMIKFINIMSDSKDSSDNVASDYDMLVSSYLKGDKILDDMPGIKNVKKKLFEEGDQLCGEVSFDFDKITDLRFYKFKAEGPWCYFAGTTANNMFSPENYFSSNGEYGGQNMPVIFWEGSTKEFKFKTTVTAPGEKTVSLIDMWKTKGEK